MAKKFDIIGSGYVPCNKKRFREARLVFFRPGWGIISVEFGNGLKVGMRRDERDEKGRLKNDFVRVIEYRGDKICDIGHKSYAKEFRGLGFWESSSTEFMFSRKAYPTGDLRDIIPDALKEAGLANKNWKRFFLLSKQGEFWDRPLPMGAKEGMR